MTADQDGDGLLDGQEDVDADGIYFWGNPTINDKPTMGGTGTQPIASPNSTGIETDPCNEDSDGDLIGDYDESKKYGTDPADTDTDDDGLTDGAEAFGQVPGPMGSKQVCDAIKADTDGDGLSDGEEGSLGMDGYLTYCGDTDSDNGGVTDGDEYYILRLEGGFVPSNPLDPANDKKDTDGDGISDYDELTTSTCLNPKAADTDGDTLKDGEELWGIKNTKYGNLPTDPCKMDTDGDQISDGDEIKWTGTDPNKADTDGDGLKDNEELFVTHTDPTKADTDGDGLNDGEEVNTTRHRPAQGGHAIVTA